LEQSSGGEQFTASVMIMPLISVPSQELLFIEFNGFEKHWRPGYCGTNGN